MPRDSAVIAALHAYQRRVRVAAVCAVLVAASAAGGLVAFVVLALGGSGSSGQAMGAAAFALCAAIAGAWWWRQWTTRRIAALIEARDPSLDNLLVTAEEIALGGRHWHPAIEAAVAAGALERLARVPAPAVQPLARPLVFATGAVMALAGVLVSVPASVTPPSPGLVAAGVSPTDPLAAGDVRAVITPPEYVKRAATALINPETMTALEGSRIRLEVARDASAALVSLDGAITPFGESATVRALELVADESQPLLVRFSAASGAPADRLIHVRVRQDERPVVQIRQPGKDLILPDANHQVPVEIEARDDVALSSVALRYTRVSGSGETFDFEEGELPVHVERAAPGQWIARGEIGLATLKLQDGDTLVYRAVARDARPGSDPSASNSYLVEVGRLAGVASMGFALPEERDRQAISQQMLIIKTERLHADRDRLSRDAFVEQAQLLAVEQRMVKAEFVFMTGGHVEDEIEEAEHSHDLAEGRLENAAAVELLTAIREMSRAEARLNAADTAEALEFERAALKALQRAFDRRRYLLRTLPERARIDPARRLTGELTTARSSARDESPIPPDPLVEHGRALLADLDRRDAVAADLPALGARLLSLDPSSEGLQQAALRLAAAQGAEAIDAALGEAERQVVDAMRARLAKGAAVDVRRQPLMGRVAQELRRGAPR